MELLGRRVRGRQPDRRRGDEGDPPGNAGVVRRQQAVELRGTLLVVGELTLQLVEDAIASRTSVSALDPIRDELFPLLEHARTIEDAETAIHGAVTSLAWLGDALVPDQVDGQVDGESGRDALARALPRMLAIQDELERVIEAASGAIAARKVLLAQETLRRFFAVCAQASRNHTALSLAAMSSRDYVRGVALRLAVLIVAVEYLAAAGSVLAAPLADKAFETSQTLRRAMREVGFDLTPWTDAPAATRARRILEAANGFWSSLDDEQRRAVDEAWGERVELPPRWPQLPS